MNHNSQKEKKYDYALGDKKSVKVVCKRCSLKGFLSIHLLHQGLIKLVSDNGEVLRNVSCEQEKLPSECELHFVKGD